MGQFTDGSDGSWVTKCYSVSSAGSSGLQKWSGSRNKLCVGQKPKVLNFATNDNNLIAALLSFYLQLY